MGFSRVSALVPEPDTSFTQAAARAKESAPQMPPATRRAFRWQPKRICAVPWPVLLATFAVLTALCALFPFSSDDWYWGGSASEARIANFFADYNGRYFSTLLCIALTRVPFLHAPVVAATLAGIALCVQKLVGRPDTSMFWLSLLLVFLAPSAVFAQGLVWTSGFVNYTLSALFILLYVVAVRGCLDDDYRPCKKLVAPLAVLGFLASLVLETMTIANIVASFVVLVYTKRRHGKIDPAQLAFFLGALAGAALMFSNGAYLAIAQGDDPVKVNGKSYRELASDGLAHGAFTCLSKSMSPYLVVRAWPMQAFFCAFALLSCIRARRAGDKRRVCFMACLTIVFGAIAIYGICYTLAAPDKLTLLLKCANALAFAAQVLALLAWCVLLWRDGRKKALLVFLYALALALPLLFVSLYGPRCYLPPYILLAALVCLLANECAPTPRRRLTACTCAAAALMFSVLVALYTPIHAADVERAHIVQEAKETGATELVVPSLNAGELVWNADPDTEGLANRFLQFYGLDKDVEIRVQE